MLVSVDPIFLKELELLKLATIPNNAVPARATLPLPVNFNLPDLCSNWFLVALYTVSSGTYLTKLEEKLYIPFAAFPIGLRQSSYFNELSTFFPP